MTMNTTLLAELLINESISSSSSSSSSSSIPFDSWEQSQINATKSDDDHDHDDGSSSFDKRLRDKLFLFFHSPTPPPTRQQSSSSCSSSTFDMRRHQIDDNNAEGSVVNDSITNSGDVDDTTTITFQTIRTLFRNAAQALQYELAHPNHRREDSTTTATAARISSNSGSSSSRDTKSTQVHCHWIPGRIEVMGKHTDYAGGNSLVCATARRGMAMISTFIENHEKVAALTVGDAASGGGDIGDGSSSCCSTRNDNGGHSTGNHSNNSVDAKKKMKVTIVSVLPPGMDHHARTTAAAETTTTAPYQVDGRRVVRHTIHLSGEENQAHEKEEDCDHIVHAKDWTVYPTTVIQRLHHNFGLFSHRGGGGGHLFIAISSNLPPASGLSTSSALVTGLFLAVNSHFHLSKSDKYRNAIGDEKDNTTVYNLSTYLGNIENGRDYIHNGVALEGTVHGGVGTFGGSEDHAAILLGKIGELSLLSFCPTRPACIDMKSLSSNLLNNNEEDVTVGKIDSTIRLPTDVTFVIAYTGVKAEKAGGADGNSSASLGYNSASELARCALNAYLAGVGGGGGGGSSGKRRDDIQTIADAIRWERNHLPSASFSDIRCAMSKCIMAGATSLDEGEVEYSKSLVQRFVHFYNESEYLVPAAAYALSQKKYDLLGTVVDASHQGAVNLLKNQTEETAWLPLWARGKECALQLNPLLVMDTKDDDRATKNGRMKALAASAFGAGFGGSCWALVYRHDAHEFARQWRAAFEERFPRSKQISDGVREFFITDPGPGAFCV